MTVVAEDVVLYAAYLFYESPRRMRDPVRPERPSGRVVAGGEYARPPSHVSLGSRLSVDKLAQGDVHETSASVQLGNAAPSEENTAVFRDARERDEKRNTRPRRIDKTPVAVSPNLCSRALHHAALRHDHSGGGKRSPAYAERDLSGNVKPV